MRGDAQRFAEPFEEDTAAANVLIVCSSKSQAELCALR